MIKSWERPFISSRKCKEPKTALSGVNYYYLFNCSGSKFK